MFHIKKIIQKSFLFLLILGLYFLPSILFKSSKEYYNSILKPVYAPRPYIFMLAWSILYIIFALFLSINLINKNLPRQLAVAFFINYIISFFFNYFFFIKNNLFLSFCDTFLSFSSGLLIFLILFKKNRYNALIITPYLLWTAFASILMCHIYFLN